MAILMCVALPRILPACSNFSNNNQAKHYPNVLAPQSDKVWSLVSCSQPKANRTAFEILRTISENDDTEIEAQLTRLQNASQMLKGFFEDCVLVLMAMNPIIQLIADFSSVTNKLFVRESSFGALYGALIVLKECAKVLWKSQPIWVFIAVGFLIYKANMYNIALYRNGRYPVWAGIPLTALAFGKFLADCLLFLTCSKPTCLNIILALIDIMASVIMSTCFIAYTDQNRVERVCQFKSNKRSARAAKGALDNEDSR